MSLHNVEEHRNCPYYATADTGLFRQYRLAGGEDVSGRSGNKNVLLYVATGAIEFSMGGGHADRMESESMVLLPKNTAYHCRVEDRCHIIASFFHGQVPLCSQYDLTKSADGAEDGAHAGVAGRATHLAANHQVASFFENLVRSLDDGLNCLHFHKMKQDELCIMLRCYYSHEELYDLLGSAADCGSDFREQLLENSKGVYDVATLAERMNMSVRTFQRRFKEEFHCMPHDWLKERRAEIMHDELCNTDKTISQIASELGFATTSYFTTFCRQCFCMTPSELRHQTAGEDEAWE